MAKIRNAIVLVLLLSAVGVLVWKKQPTVVSRKTVQEAVHHQDKVSVLYSLAIDSQLNLQNPAVSALSYKLHLVGELQQIALDEHQQLLIVNGRLNEIPIESRYVVQRDDQGLAQSMKKLAGKESGVDGEIQQLILFAELPKQVDDGVFAYQFEGDAWSTTLVKDRGTGVITKTIDRVQHAGKDPSELQAGTLVVLEPAIHGLKRLKANFRSEVLVKELSSRARVERTLELLNQGTRVIAPEDLQAFLQKDPALDQVASAKQEPHYPAVPMAQVWPKITELSKHVPQKPDQGFLNKRAQLIFELRDSLVHEPAQLVALKTQLSQLPPESLAVTIALSAIHNAKLPEGQQILSEILDSRSQDVAWVDRLAPMLGFTEKPSDQIEQSLRSIIQDGSNTEAAQTSLLALGNLASNLEEGNRKESILRDLAERLNRESDPINRKVLILALGNTAMQAAKPLVRPYLQAADAPVREAAEIAMKQLPT